MERQPTQWLMKMWLEGRMIIEVIHDQLAQITGCWLRVQMFKQLLKSLDMSIIPAMDDVLPDMRWNEPYPPAPHEARTICTQRVFRIIDVDKCIREPAWVEGGRRPSADGMMKYLMSKRMCVPDIDRSSCVVCTQTVRPGSNPTVHNPDRKHDPPSNRVPRVPARRRNRQFE